MLWCRQLPFDSPLRYLPIKAQTAIHCSIPRINGWKIVWDQLKHDNLFINQSVTFHSPFCSCHYLVQVFLLNSSHFSFLSDFKFFPTAQQSLHINSQSELKFATFFCTFALSEKVAWLFISCSISSLNQWHRHAHCHHISWCSVFPTRIFGCFDQHQPISPPASCCYVGYKTFNTIRIPTSLLVPWTELLNF